MEIISGMLIMSLIFEHAEVPQAGYVRNQKKRLEGALKKLGGNLSQRDGSQESHARKGKNFFSIAPTACPETDEDKAIRVFRKTHVT